MLHNISHVTEEVLRRKKFRLYVWIIRRLGVKEGLYPYSPSIAVKLVRFIFFFKSRLMEFLYWRGIFTKDGDEYVLNTPKNKKRIETKERLKLGKYHSGMD